MRNSSAIKLTGLSSDTQSQTASFAYFSIEVFAPNSQVWLMTDHGLRQQRILRVTTESRAILSDLTHTETAITYLLDDGTSRPAHEVFATKEQLISSL